MKSLKKKIAIFLLVVGLLIIHFLYLKPFLNEHYFWNDLQEFKKNSQKFYLIIVVLVCAILFVREVIIQKKKVITEFLPFVFIVFSFVFLGQGAINDYLICLNTKINVKPHIKSYTITSNPESGVFTLYNGNSEAIVFPAELEKINSERLKKQQKSIFELQNKDTIHILFKKGIFNVKFL